MNISRRWFIGGAASFGAFGGCRFFSSHDFKAGGTPKLKFGVVSDIHLLRITPDGKPDDGYGSSVMFRKTLEWFRDQGVDAVMIAGDMADGGMDDHLMAVSDTWYRVFPNDRYPDGRPIEKVFVYGNHDFHGYLYGGHAKKRYPDENECRKHVIRADLKGWWEKAFHEEYSRLYVKDIKGYRFIGSHWDDGTGMEGGYGRSIFGVDLQRYLDENGKSIDPMLPFFYVQHPHPKDTCYGSWAWGHDGGLSTKALSAYPNAVAFSGHSHYSLTDERSVWQGAFTSVGTSSLRYTGMPYNMRLPVGYENTTTEGKDSWKHDAVKMMPDFETGDCQQGMLWSVYDDCMVVRRREFRSGLDLGDDWVIPLPAAESRPFAFAERARFIGAPEFPKDAAIKIVSVKAKNRGCKNPPAKNAPVPAVEKPSLKLEFPAATVVRNARAFDFEVVARGANGKEQVKYVMAQGFNHAEGHRKASLGMTCVFAIDELPSEEVEFSVTPINCYGKRGKALTAKWRKA